ncbi:MAG: alpha/beta hydrolase [Homoserinimonas sp.]|nr:alpha/beta hydrolase [Homoserinimonas sp.]
MPSERITSYRRAGLTFDVSDSGPSGGPAVVLLHGFPSHRGCWDAVTPILNAAGLRTLAPNQRGYAARAKALRRQDYRAAEVTADAIALLDAAHLQRVHLVGHDWGGFVAWRLAASAPERISGITVLSTPHPSALVRSFFSSNQALRCALNWYRGMWLPERRRDNRNEIRRNEIRVPTTYLWGKRDQALGPRAAELTARYVKGPYRFIALDENHWLPELAAQRVAQEIVADIEGLR